jgi:hypothetical protein
MMRVIKHTLFQLFVISQLIILMECGFLHNTFSNNHSIEFADLSNEMHHSHHAGYGDDVFVANSKIDTLLAISKSILLPPAYSKIQSSFTDSIWQPPQRA